MGLTFTDGGRTDLVSLRMFFCLEREDARFFFLVFPPTWAAASEGGGGLEEAEGAEADDNF
eukprot:CAMPEP_0182454084 /NCGR_PEP_ID=MMETSP1319-20130603/869_1 /TAXON_ID=172717 /ORGANISM="Bolidomonas pacifica, Strain RCC208" /LENGTH=60 /DNA_ID=CAMNT_0024652057 /DNA_START=70 /DNA_END=252 /DNA_ORIENTATION=-